MGYLHKSPIHEHTFLDLYGSPPPAPALTGLSFIFFYNLDTFLLLIPVGYFLHFCIQLST